MHAHYDTFRQIGLAATVMAMATFFAGCFGGNYTPISNYALRGEVEAVPVPGLSATLGVRPLDYVRFYKQRMVYRDNDFAIGYDDYHQWAELPRDAITRMVVDGLAASGRFADSGYAHDLARPDYILTGQLRRLDELRAHDPWTAYCEVRFELRDRNEAVILWSETLSAEVLLESNTPLGFAAAASQAAVHVAAQAVERIVRHEFDR